MSDKPPIKKESSHFESDSVREHFLKMLAVNSVASEFRMKFDVIHGGGINDVNVVMFIVLDPEIIAAFRSELERIMKERAVE